MEAETKRKTERAIKGGRNRGAIGGRDRRRDGRKDRRRSGGVIGGGRREGRERKGE